MTECPHIMVSVGQDSTLIPALLDTGAEMSCINQEYYTRLLQEGNIFPEIPVCNVNIVTATGGKSKRISKQVRLPIMCQDVKMEVNCLVVPKLLKNLVLGHDWMETYQVTICYAKETEPGVLKKECQLQLRGGRQIRAVIDGDALTVDHTDNKVEGSKQVAVLRRMTDADEDNDYFQQPGCNANGTASLTQQRELSEEQQVQLGELLDKFDDVFSDIPGKTHVYTHRLEVTDESPFCGRTYPVAHAHRGAVQRAINSMLDADVIERSNTMYINPLVVVAKKDGNDPRICIDARLLNARIKSAYERPEKIMDLVRKFHGKTWLTSLDLTSGYWQVPLAKEDRKYTGFGFGGIGFQFKRVPFGVKSASAAFIRALHLALGNDVQGYSVVYIDDIVIFSDSFEDHLRHVAIILTKLREAGMTVKKTKSAFCRAEVKFLGHRVTSVGLGPDPEKIAAIQHFPTPRTQRQLRSFMGLCSFFRQFVPSYARTVEDLRSLLGGKNKWRWTDEADKAFKDLKEAFENRVLLSQPNFNLPFIIETDACLSGLSGVLYQEEQGEKRIISMVSRGLNSAEKKFTISEIEMLAIVFAVSKFREYVLGKPLTVITDHKALQFLMSSKLTSSRLTRWVLYLQEYDFKVVYRPGTDNFFCDYLSRHPLVNGKMSSEEERSQGVVIGAAKVVIEPEVRKRLKGIRKAQKDDEFGRKKLEELLAPAEDMIAGKDKRFQVLDGYLCHVDPKEGNRIWVPPALVKDVIWTYHYDTGHCGASKCQAAIARNFWWKGMSRTIRRVLRTCDRCQKAKYPRRYLEGKWNSTLPQEKGELVLCDYYGPLPKSKGGFQYVFVLIDGFTKYVKLYPLRRATTKMSLKKFLVDYCGELGKPKKILSDNGTQFVSPIWANTLDEAGIKAIRCSIRNPQGNLAERIMSRLGQAFRTYCSRRHTAWIDWLCLVEKWINHAVHSSTGCTPIELQLGAQPQFSVPKLLGIRQDEAVNMDWQVRLARERMEKASIQRGKQQKRLCIDVFEPGDEVLLRVPGVSNAEKKEIGKMFDLFHGPFIVSRRIHENTYELNTVQGQCKGKFNLRSLRRYHYAVEPSEFDDQG